MSETALRLRDATRADFEFTFDVEIAALGPYIEATFGLDETALRALHATRFDASLTRIIVDADCDVGLVKVRAEDDTLRLLQLFLLPDAQGRGIGSHVMRRVLAESGAAGRSVALRVLRTNPRARAFYERLGFALETVSDTHWMLRSDPGQA